MPLTADAVVRLSSSTAHVTEDIYHLLVVYVSLAGGHYKYRQTRVRSRSTQNITTLV